MKLQIKRWTYVLLLLGTFQMLSAQSTDQVIKGLWEAGDRDESAIQIELKEDGYWYGTIVKTNVPRSIGKLLFKNGVFDPKKEAIKGILIHPDSGWEVNGKLSLESPNKLKVLASKFIISKTFYWTRT